MSLPYLPGWGDTLAQHLPKIGENIGKITNPYREEEDMFKKLIATKPELMDDFAQREQDSPGALKGIFGKKVSDFVRSQPISEQYQVARKREKVALEAGELGTQAQRIGIDKETLDLMQDKELAEFRKNNKAVNEAYKYRVTTGKTSAEDLANSLRQDKAMMKRSELAKKYEGTSGIAIAHDYKNGKISADTLQGIIENDPAAMSAAFAILDDETRGQLQRDLHKMSADREDKYLLHQKIGEAIRSARQYGIDNPNAYAEIVFGETLEGLPEPTEADRTQAANVFAANDVKRDLVASEKQRTADQAIFDKLQGSIAQLGKQGGVTDTERAIIEGNINGNLARLGKRFGYKAAEIPQYKRVKGAGDGWYQGDTPLGRQGPNVMSGFVNKIAAKLAEDTTTPDEEEPPDQSDEEDETAEQDTTGATARGALGASGERPITLPKPTAPRDTTGLIGPGGKKRKNPFLK